MSGVSREKPIIATVIGDPGGIGPEVCVKALADGALGRMAHHLLIGDLEAIRVAATASGLNVRLRQIARPDEAASSDGAIAVLDPGNLAPGIWQVGQPSAASGRAVLAWIRLAEQLGRDGLIDGWIMAPVDSTSLKLSGGVDTLDDLQPPGTYLLRISQNLRIVPITEHISISDVPASVTREAVSQLLALVSKAFARWGVAAVRIGVAGLNPHAMGTEEVAEIAPAVAEARDSGLSVEGPISPDAIFRQAIEGRFDVVLSMYHDQGQIALKTAAFEGACTIYIGLNYVHLTVPHGSAMDIAGKGIAQPSSMTAAMRMATSLCLGYGFVDDHG
ncbi:4-hydroxythreonine-4-phosphate dehydrogenase [Novosphingobium marinum]|uniref:4-hydroxythreonine-4-phosphate dehydrogenase n=1 Tax=Novosphingobium marinum TaxID=1514948 RepID=A0A7Y9XYV5_9SPHN|nr:4-hydroxythreonine-4-phosphate dehydrogenase PdxA [Novosphingobium marinum]NYH97166.1 4-hydroxythreonine-4-phosphate dehydrogenase [Novosphingobium marinum]GGC44262.1 4-hydroxythreonine-4-phosphate dehydrogenase [Novosphingobium marinum]